MVRVVFVLLFKSMRRGRQHFKMTVCSRDGNLYIFENCCLEAI